MTALAKNILARSEIRRKKARVQSKIKRKKGKQRGLILRARCENFLFRIKI